MLCIVCADCRGWGFCTCDDNRGLVASEYAVCVAASLSAFWEWSQGERTVSPATIALLAAFGYDAQGEPV